METVANFVKRGFYKDSVQLMQLTEKAKKLEGVLDAAIVAGTELNLQLLSEAGLLTEAGRHATAADTVIAVKAAKELVPELIERVERLLMTVEQASKAYGDCDVALAENGDINIASISIPGPYVEDVAAQLLDKGLNLFVFSDHVPVEAEVRLKRHALERGLLFMGPEAGTALIGAAGLGFANAVRRGSVGIVSATGSGLQELSVLLHKMGVGVSNGLAVGGRDLTSEVGGLMTRHCIRLLDEDDQTEVIVLMFKAASEEALSYALEEGARKPVIICSLGEQVQTGREEPDTIFAAALKATLQVDGEAYEAAKACLLDEVRILKQRIQRRENPRQHVLGLFAGGALSIEAINILRLSGEPVYSNSVSVHALPQGERSYGGHLCIDMGAEEYTEGRPHPILDSTLRNQRMLAEIENPRFGVVLLDVIGGYGAHSNPAAASAEPIRQLSQKGIQVIAHVCATENDSQRNQDEILRGVGATTVTSNALAASFAAAVGKGQPELMERLVRQQMLV